MIWTLIRPFLGYIVGTAAFVGVASGFYFKIKHDGVLKERARIEREKDVAIKKGTEARERIRTLCSNNPLQCVPQDWFRD